MTTYTSSKFMSPSKLDIDDKHLDSIFSSIHELDKFNKPKTSAELQRMLDQHFFCTHDVASAEEDVDDDTVPEPVKVAVKEKSALDSIFEGVKEASSAPTIAKQEDDTDAKLKELLAGL